MSGDSSVRQGAAGFGPATLFVGVSFVVLVFVAVPLKRIFGVPLGMHIMGPLHGLLFAWFTFALWRQARVDCWSARRVTRAFVLASIPFGAFYLHREMQRRA